MRQRVADKTKNELAGAGATAIAAPAAAPGVSLPGTIPAARGSERSKNIEESLRQSEERYRRLVEQAPDAIVVHTDGKIVFINDAGVRLWGGQLPSDFIGREIMDFVHPRHREMVQRRIRRVLAGETSPLVEQLNRRLDGRSVRVEATGMPCTYDGVPSIQVIVRDVTKRKRAQRQIRKQREIFKKFFDRVPLLVGFFDADGRVKVLNRQWKRMLGGSKEATIFELLHRCYPDPEKRRRFVDYLRAAPVGWQDFRVQARNGRILDVAWANIVLSDGTRIAIGKDMTKRKAAEEALRTSKAELEQRVYLRTEELSRKNRELQLEISERRRVDAQLRKKQQFMERMLSTHERERQLVAYEIHDTFVQDVIAALMFVDAAHDAQRDSGQNDLERLEHASKLLRKSIDEARRMISGLRPPIIDEQGIVAAIDYLVNELNARGMEVHFSHAISVRRLAPPIESAIFRIVQEGLANVERHSRSRFAEVKLTQPGELIRLEIRDRGVGFDPDAVEEGHYGLQGIRERARLIGAAVSVVSARGEGTQIIVEVPVLPERDAPQEVQAHRGPAESQSL